MRVRSNRRGQGRAALPLVVMYWRLEGRICCMNNERNQHKLASDTNFDSCGRSCCRHVADEHGLQGAAHLERDTRTQPFTSACYTMSLNCELIF